VFNATFNNTHYTVMHIMVASVIVSSKPMSSAIGYLCLTPLSTMHIIRLYVTFYFIFHNILSGGLFFSIKYYPWTIFQY
jgi:hypothetical protein